MTGQAVFLHIVCPHRNSVYLLDKGSNLANCGLKSTTEKKARVWIALQYGILQDTTNS